MDAVLVVLSCVAAAALVARVQGHHRLAAPELLVGLFAGIASAMMARHIGAESLALPIFFGCALTLALAPLKRGFGG
jgi:hypothetical protein